MKNITTFEFDNPIKGVLVPIILSSLALFWVILFCLAWNGINVSTGSKFWVFFGVSLLNATSNFLYQNIFVGANVLNKLRTPHHLWDAFLRGAIRSALSVWTMLGLGILAMVAVAIPSWNLLTVAAIISTVMCAGTLANLSNYGRLPRIFMWASWIGGITVAAAIVYRLDFDSYLRDLDKIPFLLRGTLVLAWPALIFVLLRNWRNTPPVQTTLFSTSPYLVKERINAYLQRFTALELDHPLQKYQRTSSQVGRISMVFFNQIMFSALYMLQGTLSWSDSAGVGRLFIIFYFSLLGVNCLVFKDLHWRRMLAPNQLQRNRLGWHIFKYSAIMQLAVFFLAALLISIFSIGVLNLSVAKIISTAWQNRLAPFELMTTVACAVLLHAKVNKSVWKVLGIAAATGLIAIFMFVTYGDIPKWPAWPITDVAYGLVLFFTSCVFIIFSNKVLTAKRLVGSLRPT
jgi:hypothetical protein